MNLKFINLRGEDHERTKRPLRDIFKVCETGSFSKAAEALNYTQSGISQMMAGLEEELGVQLFARVKRGVSLTDNGARLIPYIQEMVNQKDKLRQAAFNINNKIEGKLRVGSFPASPLCGCRMWFIFPGKLSESGCRNF